MPQQIPSLTIRGFKKLLLGPAMLCQQQRGVVDNVLVGLVCTEVTQRSYILWSGKGVCVRREEKNYGDGRVDGGMKESARG